MKAKDILFGGLQLLLFTVILLVPFKREWHLSLRFKGPFLAIAVIGVLLAVLAILQLGGNLSPFLTPVWQETLIKPVCTKESGILSTLDYSVFFGYAIWEVSLYNFSIALLLLLMFYFKSRYEERLLVEKFPDNGDYQNGANDFSHSYN